MRRLSLCLSFLLVLTYCFVNQSVQAKPQYDVETQKELEEMLAQAWEIGEDVFSSEERRALHRIVIKVTDSPDFTQARTSLQSQTIEISHGFGIMTWGMSVAMVISIDFGKPEFLNQYARYLAQNADYTNNLKLPWDVANLSRGEIDKLQSPVYSRKIASFMIGSLSFILLHECGHHIIKYRKGDNYPINPSLKESRAIEREADMWSAEIMAKAGVAPFYAIIPHLYFHYRDENAVRFESSMTHPPALFRIYDIIFYNLMYLDEYYDPSLTYAKSPIEEVRSKGMRALKYTQSLIASTKYFDQPEIYGDVDRISSPFMRGCMRVADEKCMAACQNKYNNPYSVCRDRMCSSKKQKQISWFRCEQRRRHH